MKCISLRTAALILALVLFACMAGCSSDDGTTDDRRSDAASAVEKTEITRRNAPRSRDRSRPTSISSSSGAANSSRDNTRTDNRATTIPNVKVSGVISLPDGAPAAAATVKLWTTFDDTETSIVWHLQQETQTRADGTYQLEAPRKDYWAVTASKENYAVACQQEQRTQFSKEIPPIPARINLRLHPEVPFSGTVLSPDGVPVAGANVLAAPMDEASAAIAEISTFTDPAGRFTLKGLHSGAAKLAVSSPRYSLEIADVTAPDNNVTIKLSDKQPRLHGHVTSHDTDLRNTTVTLKLEQGIKIPGLHMRWSKVIDTEGNFDFGPVPADKLMLSVAAKSPRLYPVQPSNNISLPSIPLQLADGQSTTVELLLTTGKTLRGKVIDEETSAPLSDVRLYASKSDEKEERNFVETTATGEFILPHVPDIRFVQVDSDFYHHTTPFSEMTDKDFLNPLTIVMRRSPLVRGSVLASVGGAVAGATLNMYKDGSLYVEGETIPIQAGGSFQTGVQPGKYIFVAEARGYAQTLTAPVHVSTEDVNDVKIVLGAGRSVSGTVLSPDGRPFPAAIVTATAPPFGNTASMLPYTPVWGSTTLGPPFATAISDASGKFKLDLLPVDANLIVAASAAGFAHPALASVASGPDPINDLKLILPQSGPLNGNVFDEEGDPVPGADISVSARSQILHYSANAVSSTSGHFALLNAPRDSTATLSITKAGYDRLSKSLMISDTPVSITLHKTNTRTISVRCIDAGTEKPIDAKLELRALFNTNGMPAPLVVPIKDKPGEYLASGVIVGEMYSFKGTAPGYSDDPTYEEITGKDDQEVVYPMRLSGIISGRVVGDGKPVPNAKIITSHSSSGPAAVTDELGRFEFSVGNSYGQYTAAAPDGRMSSQFSPVMASGDAVDVGDIEVFEKVPLKIRVLEGGTNKPMRDVTVVVQTSNSRSGNEKSTGKTDRQGIFETSAFSAQGVSVELPDYDISKRSSQVRDSSEELVITCIVGSGSFRGRLIYNDEPVAGTISGTHLDVTGTGVNVRAGSDGKFEFKNLAPGNWKFNGYGSDRFAAVTIRMNANGDSVERDIVLVDGAISGRVVNEAGQPVSGAEIRFRAKDAASGNTESDAQGAFSVNMPPGVYEILAEKASEGRSEPTTVQVSETGESSPITIVIKASPVTITCTILSILDGMPIDHAWAQLRSGEEALSHNGTSTGSNGDLVIDNVSPGNYQLTVSANGYNEVKRSITVEPGQNLAFTDVLTPAASLAVTVTDSNGYLVKNAPVTVTPTDSGSIETVRNKATDDSGSASFPGLLYGTYTVSVTTPAGQTATGSVSTHNSKMVNYRLTVPADK